MSDESGMPAAGLSDAETHAAESAAAEAADVVKNGVKDATRRIGDALEAGRKPGMPLDVLSQVVRNAPLQSLFIAFLLGIAVARR
jgi:hypothetical protein